MQHPLASGIHAHLFQDLSRIPNLWMLNFVQCSHVTCICLSIPSGHSVLLITLGTAWVCMLWVWPYCSIWGMVTGVQLTERSTQIELRFTPFWSAGSGPTCFSLLLYLVCLGFVCIASAHAFMLLFLFSTVHCFWRIEWEKHFIFMYECTISEAHLSFLHILVSVWYFFAQLKELSLTITVTYFWRVIFLLF